MNYNCKYCDYVDRCSRKCEYDSVLCKMNRSFPKIVNRPYKEILYENSDLKLENASYKQALIDIREKTIKWDSSNTSAIDDYYFKEDILQIIDKVLGGSDENN